MSTHSITLIPVKVSFKGKQVEVFAGDRIIRAKENGLVKHHIVVANGQLAENHPDSGVRYISVAELNRSGNILEIQPFKGSNEERCQIIQRIGELINFPYNLQTYNCEHFANDVIFGKPFSKQMTKANVVVGSAAIGGIILLAVASINKNRGTALLSLLPITFGLLFFLFTHSVQGSPTLQLSR